MRQSVKWLAIAMLVTSPVVAQEVFDVSLDGQQVPVVTTFKGSGTVTLNAAETQITVSITHNIPNGNVTDGHIHIGAAGVNGGIVLPFPGQGANPISETINVTSGQVTTLRNAGYYVNIHTFAFPAGEIRGQILPRQDDDHDLLSDFAEDNGGTFVSSAQTGTDPNDPDTDGDGVIDGVEVSLGTDPNDNGDTPNVPLDSRTIAIALASILIASAGFVLYRRKSRTI